MQKNTVYIIHPFTLVELLMVIMVIAILASILLPSLNQTLQFAKKQDCTYVLKNLGYVTQMYLDDHNNYYYYSNINYKTAEGKDLYTHWPWFIYPYYNDGKVAPHVNSVDPLLPKSFRCKGQGAENVTAPIQIYQSNATTIDGKKSVSLTQPSMVFLFMDSIYDIAKVDRRYIFNPINSALGINEGARAGTNPIGSYCVVGYTRHLLSVNSLFADLHVGSLKRRNGPLTVNDILFK